MMTEAAQSLAVAPASVIPATEYPRKVRWGRIASALAVLALFAALTWCILYNHCSPTGEPFSLNEGISIWPSEIVCAFAAALSAIFFLKARIDLLENKQKLHYKFSLREAFTLSEVNKAWRDHLDCSRPGQRTDGRKHWIRLTGPYLNWISIRNWECSRRIVVGDCDNREAAAESFSTHYNVLGFWPHRICRCMPSIIAYALFAWGVFWLGHSPFVPYRGSLSGAVDKTVFWVSVVSQTALIFFTVDASCLCRKFIDNLAEMETLPWSNETEAVFKKRCGLGIEFTEEFIAAEIIGERSAAVGRLIFYPFFVLFLTIISRASFFDHWDWPVSLILIFGINAAVAAYSVWALRRAAEGARKELLERLNSKIRRCREDKTPGLVDTLKDLAREIESNEEGAFAPITKQPVIHALLMPLGAAGLSTVLNFLPRL